MLITVISCKKQDYYELPVDSTGNVLFTTNSSTDTKGISTLDGSFTVTATFATAKVGDVMKVELLQLQIPENGGATKQLLPMAGTQKTVTVGSDMKASVTYSRDEAKMSAANDYVTVTFSGATDYAKVRVDMVPAITVSKPKAGDKEIDVARTNETAFFIANVTPKSLSSFDGQLIVQRKNGVNAGWVTVNGSPFSGSQPFKIPIIGNEFASDKDTMIYSFSSTIGSYTDVVTKTVIVRDPYFYFKKSATLTLGGSTAGLNLIKNKNVSENDSTAIVAVSGDLILKGGSAWLAKSGNSITFVPTTSAMYELNNLNKTLEAYNAGVSAISADPIVGTGIYIYKIVNGPLSSDVYYGMLKMTTVVPGSSVSIEYRIGDQYAHLSVL